MPSPHHFLLSSQSERLLVPLRGDTNSCLRVLMTLFSVPGMFFSPAHPPPHSLTPLLTLSCYLNLSLTLILKMSLFSPYMSTKVTQLHVSKALIIFRPLGMTHSGALFTSRLNLHGRGDNIWLASCCISAQRGFRGKAETPFIHPLTHSFIHSSTLSIVRVGISLLFPSPSLC